MGGIKATVPGGEGGGSPCSGAHGEDSANVRGGEATAASGNIWTSQTRSSGLRDATRMRLDSGASCAGDQVEAHLQAEHLAPRLVPGGLRFLGGPEFKLGTGEFIGMTNIVHTIHKLKRQDQVALNLSCLSDFEFSGHRFLPV